MLRCAPKGMKIYDNRNNSKILCGYLRTGQWNHRREWPVRPEKYWQFLPELQD